MGYRSDVRIITSKKGFERLKNYVSDRIAKSNNPNIYNIMDDIEFEYDNGYSKYFGWNGVKWYYDDVDFVMEGLEQLREEDMSYRFARIGENYDDYEEESYESDNEEEQDLDYPLLERYFDDEYIINNMKVYEKDNDKEIE